MSGGPGALEEAARLELPPLPALEAEAAAAGRGAAGEPLRRALAAALGPLPARPAVYALRDAAGSPLTIGHAADLRARLVKVDGPVVAAAAVEYRLCGSAFEAALRHLAWLRALEPDRYGAWLPYPPPLYLRVDLRAKFPRFEPTDVPDLGPAVRLFGPYPTRTALEAAESALYGALPLRRCTWDVQGHDVDESCIYLQMRRCAAPCTGDVPVEAYRRLVDAGADLLTGRPERAAAELAARRDAAVGALAFEEAGRLQAALERTARLPPPAAEIARWRVAVLAPAVRPAAPPGEPKGRSGRASPAAAAAFGFRAGRLVHEGRLEPAAGDLEGQAAALAAAVAAAPEPPPGAARTTARARAEEAALLVAWLGRARPPAAVVIDPDDPAGAVPLLAGAAAAVLAPRRARPRAAGEREAGGPGER